ncbi:5'/3'-nucleotidase SurE [Haloferax sp. MBLA0076]|uniref:5'-nucleotidase SurE n=1 Tax=Haloferax litoreum TaxID=2666140 RepID=A0A6A8GKZ2_9EURY|nr:MULTISPECIES: 5'/3'-nucleotidase SurE [Haloferax]KAB1189964.1 5'/3'-nucleotidase SurE [Haloferax sp. CBA1148]MRX23736.1 5'/3'-nucleotidase SurE [Haloferax litoreum]
MSDSASPLRILLTNDDGIDAPGLAAMREELTAIGEVTVVAPAENQSGVGRARNEHAIRRDHPWGYALEGTPADCVAYGLRGLDADFDIVVSGINDGPNAGNYVVGRSGTVGAGIESAFLGTPALAISSYHARDFFCHPPEEYDFSRPARVARALTERVCGAGIFDDVDLLNVNAPIDVPNPRMRVTRPLADYDQQVDHHDDTTLLPDGDREDGLGDDEVLVRLRDVSWPDTVGYQNPFPPNDEYRARYPVGSDRRAMVDGEVSVSPLAVHHGHTEDPKLASVVESLSEHVE